MKHVFQGEKWRAQISVYDGIHYNVPEWREVSFYVAILPATSNRSTAYSKGKALYHGPRLNLAIQAITGYIKGVSLDDLPKSWSPYRAMVFQDQVFDGSNRAEWETYGRQLDEECLRWEKEQLKKMMGVER